MTETDTKVLSVDNSSSLEEIVSPSTSIDCLEPNKRNLIDLDVFTWVSGCQTHGKIITPSLIRQKAYEIGRKYDPFFKASINWYNKWKKKYNYEESAEADALKHKKRSYTAAFKLYAVQRANELLSVSQASLELNVSRRCLQRWKEEIDVISKVAEQASNAVYRRPGQGRKVADANLDTLLLEWVEKAWRNGEQVTSTSIRQKARELSTSQDFKASLGWFVKWQKRHNIDLKECTMNSPLKESDPNPLKLRLLPEGQEIVYSDQTSLVRKRKREFECPVIQGDEEFDRLLLTWLVERWEAGLLVNEKMLRDRAVELNTNQEFKPSKNWLLDWKSKYNVSLEDQTYGQAGECEGEIIEESQVYEEVALQDNNTNPLTPTKEEAATALASLASEDPTTAGGIEIAEALQKLASAFGLTPQGDVSKNPLVDNLYVTDPSPPIVSSSTLSSVLTPSTVPPSSATTYLLENGEVQVGAEEVISEEVVTDEPVLVLEPSSLSSGPSTTTYHHTDQQQQPPVVMMPPSRQDPINDNISPPSMKIPALDTTSMVVSDGINTSANNATSNIHQLTDSLAAMTSEQEDLINQLALAVNQGHTGSGGDPGGSCNLLYTEQQIVRVPQDVESEVEIAEPLMVVSAENTVEGLNEPMILLFKGEEREDGGGNVMVADAGMIEGTSTSTTEDNKYQK